jgi:diguanylate cyclase (GGDEF)-like protein
VLDSNLRQTDTLGRDPEGIVGRLGGDEFAVLLPEADGGGVEAVAERLVSALAASPLRIDDLDMTLSISVGAALFDENGCPPARELMAAADRAMYVVKAAGGGGAVLAGAPA